MTGRGCRAVWEGMVGITGNTICKVTPVKAVGTPLRIKVMQVDGHMAWTSPVCVQWVGRKVA